MSKPLAVVTSITGEQAFAAAQALSSRGFLIRGLTRRPAADIQRRMPAGFEVRQVDSDDAAALARGFEGAHVVIFTSPIDYRRGVREQLAARIAQAAGQAGVQRVVYNAAAAVFDDYDRPVSQSLKRMRDILLAGSAPAVAVQPTVYMDNLRQSWAQDSILKQGVFAYPAVETARISWISHASLGAFIAAAATADGVEGRVFDIGGPEALTGGEVANLLSSHLGRPVRYAFVPPDQFAVALNAAFGPPAGDDIADLYRYVERQRDALARNVAAYAGLGVQPESFAAWLARSSLNAAAA